MLVGAFLFFVGNNEAEKPSVLARNNSVAVGGNNSASITNIHVGDIKTKVFSSKKNTLAVIIEVLGLLVTLCKAISEMI